MKIAGIVCEYNPMHNGHVYQIEQTRKNGATHIVCVMSGNFVQRGDCAFADKWSRAQVALECGADLVVLLPTAWSCDSAQNFAFGAVSILSALDIDMLSFGSEISDVSLLKKAAKASQDEKVSAAIKEKIKSGLSYPAALFEIISAFYGKETADVLSSPNSTLAIEYIKALEKLNFDAEIFACQRKGAGHDEEKSVESFLSAGAIRNLDDFEKAKPFMPECCFEKIKSLMSEGFAPCRLENGERAILSSLRIMEKEEFFLYTDDDRGLAERIYNAVQSSVSLEELFEKAKTKNVTMSKVRRTVLRTFLKIPPEISREKPPFIRILAANQKGFEILAACQKQIPVVTKHSDLKNLSSFANEVYQTECRASDLYALFSKKIRPCALEQTRPIILFNK
ncbi:MAG: nucleotidyltransferase family protein [Acutalibacteraceae bacterium]